MPEQEITLQNLEERAITVRDEVLEGYNTAQRIGSLFKDIVTFIGTIKPKDQVFFATIIQEGILDPVLTPLNSTDFNYLAGVTATRIDVGIYELNLPVGTNMEKVLVRGLVKVAADDPQVLISKGVDKIILTTADATEWSTTGYTHTIEIVVFPDDIV